MLQARLRRSRISKFEEEQRLRESWEEKGQQIDKWQERHRAKIKEENLVRCLVSDTGDFNLNLRPLRSGIIISHPLYYHL